MTTELLMNANLRYWLVTHGFFGASSCNSCANCIFLPQSELKALVFFQLLFSFFISHYIKPDFSRISPLVVMIELPAERKEDR